MPGFARLRGVMPRSRLTKYPSSVRLAAGGRLNSGKNSKHPLFEPCDRYRADPDLALDPGAERSCVDCREQYRENVCPEFRQRLLDMAGEEGLRL